MCGLSVPPGTTRIARGCHSWSVLKMDLPGLYPGLHLGRRRIQGGLELCFGPLRLITELRDMTLAVILGLWCTLASSSAAASAALRVPFLQAQAAPEQPAAQAPAKPAEPEPPQPHPSPRPSQVRRLLKQPRKLRLREPHKNPHPRRGRLQPSRRSVPTRRNRRRSPAILRQRLWCATGAPQIQTCSFLPR